MTRTALPQTSSSRQTSPSRRSRRRVRGTGVLDVLSPTFLVVLGLLVLSVYCGQEPALDVLRGGVLAILVAWLPQLLLPSGTSHRRTGTGHRKVHRSWPGVLAAVFVLFLGLTLGLWGQVPYPVLVLTVTVWIAVLATSVISRWWPMCRQTTIAGVVAAALTVQIWPLGANALLLVVLVGVASARTDQHPRTGVAAAAGLGLILGAVPMLLWG